MNTVKPSTEFKLLQALFGVYAMLIMSWIPRFPEVKANLGLSNGQFGTLISTGSFGAVASLFLTGHMVHKFGVKRVILTNIWIMGFAYFFIVRTDSSGIFLIHVDYSDHLWTGRQPYPDHVAYRWACSFCYPVVNCNDYLLNTSFNEA